MKKLLIATHNNHKVEEIKHLLSDLLFEVLSLSDIRNPPKTIEDRPTLEGNALKKAREAFHTTGMLTLADDTGLECYYLELQPGVFSARYAGENATYADNNKKLLSALKGVPARRRHARFRTVVAVAGPKIEKIFEGKVEGKILEYPQGTLGFGYDPLFVPAGHSRSFAEMALVGKNQLSHRSEALKKTITFLKTL
ncbi:MAG: RdgB/HAM1 family non-canonical purine NTP pyrophosphatase [Bacteroidota bacterium]|nr:RdgB/HAM1 family non-canonical purine NTP pyrophosphatase [Bacteroidota bacterium]